MSKYFSLLNDRKIDEAEAYRKSLVPSKLLKFVSLSNDNESNNKKFNSLLNNQAWFSSVNILNDPYEFKCMYIDEERLKEYDYPEDVIANFKRFLDEQTSQWSVLSLSAAGIDSLPMWAYYTNNYQGFCIEYEVERPDAVLGVSYEPKRVPVATTITNFFSEFRKMQDRGEETNAEVEFYTNIFRYQLHSKHESWKHEKEFRVLFPLLKPCGQNVSINEIGLKTSKIIAGLNCSEHNKYELNLISNALGCGNVLELSISGQNYTVFN